MTDASEKVGALSRMKQDFDDEALEGLKDLSGNYANRLATVAQETFQKGHLLRGTCIGRPRIVAFDQKNKLEEMTMPVGFSMFVRHLPTPEGTLVMFPLHALGTTVEGKPIIYPEAEGSYTIVHVPGDNHEEIYDPAYMKIDMVFTVDRDDAITVNGRTSVTPEESELFTAIVQEFEQRAFATEVPALL